jgi:DNA-binding GntR family transcriptional regulator
VSTAGYLPLERVAARRDLVRRTYEELRERLAPGARLVEGDVTVLLGVSRTTVRAAFQRLQQEGYVAGTTRSGRSRPAVTPLTREDVVELFTMVGEIEGMAAERAAALSSGERERLAGTLAGINAGYLAAAEAHWEGDALFELDTRFHRSYVEAGGGPRLVALHDAIKPQAERYIRYYQAVLTEAIRTSVAEHRAIVDRIASGEPRAAQEAVRMNWRNAASRLGAAIERRGELGIW